MHEVSTQPKHHVISKTMDMKYIHFGEYDDTKAHKDFVDSYTPKWKIPFEFDISLTKHESREMSLTYTVEKVPRNSVSTMVSCTITITIDRKLFHKLKLQQPDVARFIDDYLESMTDMDRKCFSEDLILAIS